MESQHKITLSKLNYPSANETTKRENSEEGITFE
jgi:hypothetical protein